MKLKRNSGGLAHFWCPGCDTAHGIRTAPMDTPWEWNGSLDAPTFHPSVLAKTGSIVCHSYVENGKIRFLNDCTHDLKGQVVDLPEWPYPEE